MNKTIIKIEFYWFLIVIAISTLLFVALYGIESIKKGITLDLNFYDTYFVIDSFSLYFYLLSLILFLVYLVRMTINRFNNFATNITFIISGILFSTQLTSIIILANWYYEFSGFTIYPPLSALKPETTQGNTFEILFYTLSILQFLVITFIVFVAIRSGIKINAKGSNQIDLQNND